MFHHPLIRIASTYLTDTGLSGGTRYLCDVDGLNKIGRTRQSSIQIAIDGTVYKQYHSNNGTQGALRFENIDTVTYLAILAIINAAETAGTTVRLYISGAETFDLDVVFGDIEASSPAIASVYKNVIFPFTVAGYHNTLQAVSNFLELEGAYATFVKA